MDNVYNNLMFSVRCLNKNHTHTCNLLWKTVIQRENVWSNVENVISNAKALYPKWNRVMQRENVAIQRETFCPMQKTCYASQKVWSNAK